MDMGVPDLCVDIAQARHSCMMEPRQSCTSQRLTGGRCMVQPAAHQQQQQQQVGPLGVAVQADLAAVREIEALRDAFTGGPAHPRYRFACLLLNVVDDPAARQKPPGAPCPAAATWESSPPRNLFCAITRHARRPSVR